MRDIGLTRADVETLSTSLQCEAIRDGHDLRRHRAENLRRQAGKASNF
jgi:hypothetical protein